MDISIIGTGYVGLVTGTCLAELGHNVICVDNNPAKLTLLKNGKSPIYEEGLDELLIKNIQEKRLSFTKSIEEATQHGQMIFICVGTPQTEQGAADLNYLYTAIEDIVPHLQNNQTIVLKSTVPIGTAKKVKDILHKKRPSLCCEVINNPEFLKQGNAVYDFMQPDRIIIGLDNQNNQNIKKQIEELYTSFSSEKIIYMDNASAEMTKYVANVFLAMKISFMNEIAELAEKVGANIDNIREGIGKDPRIGSSFINAGCGYGGSCFPKDVKALLYQGEEQNLSLNIVAATNQRNEMQKNILFKKINEHYAGDLSNKTFALWGLSFKPNTDDLREAPSLNLIRLLLDAGASIQAFDPIAMNNLIYFLPEKYYQKIQLIDDQYGVLKGADALVLLTEWACFRTANLEEIKKHLNTATVFDGRNQYNPFDMKELGFTYYSIGR